MTENSELYRHKLMHGYCTRVAKKLGLSSSGRAHVSRVASGERRSPRVERALKLELARIDRLVAKHEAKHRAKQQPEFELERAA